MKKLLIGVFCAVLIIVVALYANDISSFIAGKVSNNRLVITEPKNEYAKEAGFLYVKLNENYVPYSYNDLKDVIFTAINSGYETFTFYCPSEYTSCVKDMESISKDSLILTHINNFVHPYNSFTNIKTSIYEKSGEITLKINHIYNEEMISTVNTYVDNLLKEQYDETKPIEENLKKIHDYIINTTRYDEEYNSDSYNSYESNTAYGVIVNHIAICNGYTDLMAIIASKLNITNYKIAATPDRISYKSDGHVWNALYINNKWLHMDLTWDDPISDDGKDNLYHKYFLVNNEEMQKSDAGQTVIEEHNYDPTVYLEFNESIYS